MNTTTPQRAMLDTANLLACALLGYALHGGGRTTCWLLTLRAPLAATAGLAVLAALGWLRSSRVKHAFHATRRPCRIVEE